MKRTAAIFRNAAADRHPEWHIKGDVIPLLNGNCRFQTMDGEWHEIAGRWDMLIAHPPCTYLTNAGARHLWKDHKLNQERYEKGLEAKNFFMVFLNANCPRIAVENPTPSKIYGLPKHTQSIQPWQFGHPYTKRTNLWLKGLNQLLATEVVEPVATWCPSGSYSGKHGDKHRGMFTKDRARNRSKTFPGIARAMAEQWAGPCYPDYVQRSIERLKAFEPPEGYFVAFSGGKDSQCIYHLCEMAGVKFDAHYSVTSVDPPELVRFIREKYPNVAMEIPHDKDGKPITMWNLIPKKMIPPTRLARYCCSEMKECSGQGRVTVTGVRWDESVRRKENQGLVSIPSKSKRLKKEMENEGVDFVVIKNGGIVLNDDNDINRRMVEQCYRTHKTLMNPIIDWKEDEVWHFLRDVVKVESCSLYAEGFKRLGCIGCPMASKTRAMEFARWPKYKEMYLRAFERMLIARAERDQYQSQEERKGALSWKTPQEVFDWWMETGVMPGQIRMDELMEE